MRAKCRWHYDSKKKIKHFSKPQEKVFPSPSLRSYEGKIFSFSRTLTHKKETTGQEELEHLPATLKIKRGSEHTSKKHAIVARAITRSIRRILGFLSSFGGILFLPCASSSVWYSLTANQPASLLSASLIIFWRWRRLFFSSFTWISRRPVQPGN